MPPHALPEDVAPRAAEQRGEGRAPSRNGGRRKGWSSAAAAAAAAGVGGLGVGGGR